MLLLNSPSTPQEGEKNECYRVHVGLLPGANRCILSSDAVKARIHFI
ncbi:hypothetical protein USDA257_c36270 [Sinorhizobium fredii USDA 257]|uniref:Uncharacterized protein n=1 Tax=Sinorhizobium fredii (strain USDA 257) TaxID=1185652 RepID=I3X8H3_SINF2|nr:hypothetical protein USDA257_c36270 [Sinorhizobium fredii USDA 257]